MKIYLAASRSRRAKLSTFAAQLLADGHEVVNPWLDDLGALKDEVDSAVQNLWRLRTAEIVIVFTEAPGPGNDGAQHVEFGLAIGLEKHVFVVGPRENSFHLLPKVDWYDTWPDARRGIEAITRLRRGW